MDNLLASTKLAAPADCCGWHDVNVALWVYVWVSRTVRGSSSLPVAEASWMVMSLLMWYSRNDIVAGSYTDTC